MARERNSRSGQRICTDVQCDGIALEARMSNGITRQFID
jgi:hypothetical protein